MGGEKETLLSVGYRGSVWEDGKTSGDGWCADGCTPWMCIIPLNWTLKIVKVVNFMLCIFCHN